MYPNLVPFIVAHQPLTFSSARLFLCTYMHLSAYVQGGACVCVCSCVRGATGGGQGEGCIGGERGATFRGFAVIIWQNAGESLRVLNRGSQVRGPSTLGLVICKCHSGGVLRRPTGRGVWGGCVGADRRGGAVVVFSHVDYSTTDADILLPFVCINSSDCVYKAWLANEHIHCCDVILY